MKEKGSKVYNGYLRVEGCVNYFRKYYRNLTVTLAQIHIE